MKRFSFGLLVGFLVGLVLASTSFALADQPIRLIVNGKEIQCDVPPQLINGRVLVPARFVAEPLGARVEWDEQGQAVVINSSIAQIDSKDNPPDDNLVPAFELLKQYDGENAPEGASRVLIFDNLELKIELPRSLSEGGMAIIKRNGLVVDQVYATSKSGKLFLDKRIKSYFPQ
ncbi:MAG: copper amine oxidase N-terminal domain-containing protein [Desulfitobacteriaceae bacterium]|nr:copper amine oxidase N-terminal domain-containing protein [Desulfitobacteriaceae bacterium]